MASHDGSSFFPGGKMAAARARQKASWSGFLDAQDAVRAVAQAVRAGQGEQAWALAEQTAALPFDTFEEEWPGPRAAGTSIYTLVADVVEGLDEDDASWVDQVDELFRSSTGHARRGLRHLLQMLIGDASVLAITDEEQRRLRRIVPPVQGEYRSPYEDLPQAEHADYILELAALTNALEDRLVTVPEGSGER